MCNAVVLVGRWVATKILSSAIIIRFMESGFGLTSFFVVIQGQSADLLPVHDSGFFLWLLLRKKTTTLIQQEFFSSTNQIKNRD